MTKILVEVSGGIVDTVWCDDTADVFVLDHDVDSATDEEFKAYEDLCEKAQTFRNGLRSIY